MCCLALPPCTGIIRRPSLLIGYDVWDDGRGGRADLGGRRLFQQIVKWESPSMRIDCRVMLGKRVGGYVVDAGFGNCAQDLASISVPLDQVGEG
jgi:hypothetical protein